MASYKKGTVADRFAISNLSSLLKTIARGLLADGLDVNKLTDLGRQELRNAIDALLELNCYLMRKGTDHE